MPDIDQQLIDREISGRPSTQGALRYLFLNLMAVRAFSDTPHRTDRHGAVTGGCRGVPRVYRGCTWRGYPARAPEKAEKQKTQKRQKEHGAARTDDVDDGR